MLTILFIIAGVGVGVWRGIVHHKKRSKYQTTGTAVAVIYILLSFVASALTYISVLLLPANDFDNQQYKLVSIEELVHSSDPVYVGSNYDARGKRTVSFIADMNGQTVLRNDLVFKPASIVEHGRNYRPTVTYSYPYNNYPLLFPSRIQVNGTYSTSVRLDVPRRTVEESFRVSPPSSH